MTALATETAHCKRCGQDKPLTREHWYARKDGSFYTSVACKKCQRDGAKARKEAKQPEAEPQVPLAHRLPASVVRTPVDVGGYRYDAILADGTVLELRRAAKVYTHASAYAQVRYEPGQEPEAPVVYLHGREDLAKRGDPQTNLAIRQGVSYYVRIPGVVPIVEA